jgi:argininosuccinate lyase
LTVASKKKDEGLLRGRFAGGVHPALERINRSFDVDQRLWAEDVRASLAHANMLSESGILPKEAAAKILRGLALVAKEFADGTFRAKPGDEDVHMAVERRLTELIGPDGARLHTARSRNDQVATDLRLHLESASETLRGKVREVERALVDLAKEHGEAILPFYTHLQRAQPVLLGHVLLAYVEMLEQDREGLAYDLVECPLGSGAGAGTTFPIRREVTAKGLGFRRPSPNSLEAVSSRRDAAMFAAALAALATTLSRLGADLVLWTTREFAFARLGDAVTTGSSIMPQKRNPDGAELLRGRAAQVFAAVQVLFEVQRGLPLGYAKDLQEDKRALFGAEDDVTEMLEVATAMLRDVTFDRERMRAAVDDPKGYLLATDAADGLVRKGVPFREAHEAVARLVRAAEARGVGLEALSTAELAAAHPAFDEAIRRSLTPEAAVAARSAVGGTAPANVRKAIRAWEKRLG